MRREVQPVVLIVVILILVALVLVVLGPRIMSKTGTDPDGARLERRYHRRVGSFGAGPAARW
jgi:hypothetical protein